MHHKLRSARPHMMTRAVGSAHLALSRLEREHVALLMAICELEAPAADGGTVGGSPEVREMLLAVLREDLGHTQHALRLASRGQYGLCEECHRPLSRRHLELKPASTRCLVCEARARRAVYA